MPIATDLWSLKHLLVYFAFAAMAGIGFVALERRQAAVIRGVNAELSGANAFLSNISAKVSHYLSPQVYRSIFSGEIDTTIHTKRKKLTIFFSDIADFAPTTERLQPEDLTELLNEYLTEMSLIALAHGGTIDKFIGNAILVFFGDPETKGDSEDAKACLRMAMAMQWRLRGFGNAWHDRGLQRTFDVRMGINTGYCNVGNFGSTERMDYTIIGAEVNLAARLQHMAKPGSIVMSNETYALVKDDVVAHAAAPITMKGITRQVIPYIVERRTDMTGEHGTVMSEHVAGLDLRLDLAGVRDADVERIGAVLHNALIALSKRKVAGYAEIQPAPVPTDDVVAQRD